MFWGCFIKKDLRGKVFRLNLVFNWMSENWKKFKREFYEIVGNYFGYVDWKERVEIDLDIW